MSDEYRIDKDEDEIAAERREESRKRFDRMISRTIESRKAMDAIDSGIDMAMSTLHLLRGMMKNDPEIVLDKEVREAVYDALNAVKGLTEVLLTPDEREARGCPRDS